MQTWEVAFYEPARLADGRWVPGWRPVARRLSWEALGLALTTFRAAPSKAETPGWQPVTLREPHRCLANVVEVSCLVLDLDDGADPEWLCGAGGPLRHWPHVWHTTWSSTEAHPKARVVVPLEAPCPAELFPRLWQWGQALVGGAADEQAKDASRYFYLPARGPGGDCRAGVHDPGGWLCDPRPWDKLPETPQEQATRAAREAAATRPVPRPVPGLEASFARVEASRRLNEDPAARAAHGVACGGRIQGDRVTGVLCPACGRPSVWWPLEPRGTPQGMCSHRGSCGWTGWLDGLGAP